jgi:hypothetical protein
VKHRDIDYAVEEDRPAFRRWIIYPKIEAGPKVVSEPKYRTREAAVAACINENNALRGVSMPRGPKASLVHYY